MNRRIRGLAIGASLLFCTNLVSFGCCNEGQWEVGGEALWWKPCICSFEYGLLTPDRLAMPRQYEVLKVKPNAGWGFRIWVATDRDCYFTSLDWTYLKVANTDSIGGPVEDPARLEIYFTGNNVQTKGIARVRTRYNKVRWKVAYYLHRSCDLSFHTFAGIRYVIVERTNRVNAQPTNTPEPESFIERAKWQGPAVELGIGGDYHIGCGFNLLTHVAVIGGVGQKRLSPMGFIDEGSLSQDKFGTYTSCIPALEFKVGISYAYECGCFKLTGEVGYEIDYYYGALTFIDTTNSIATSAGNMTFKCVDIGFAGPYVGVGVEF